MSRKMSSISCLVTRPLVGLALVALMLCTCAAAQATTYYVDAGAGMDSNPGTEGQPWKSIDNGDGLGLLNPGDTVMVNPGTYNVQKTGTGPLDGVPYIVLVIRSGAADNPITYRAAGPGVVIDGGGMLAGWVVGNLSPIHDLVIDGFEFSGAASGVLSNAASNITVKNCVFHDMVGTPVWGGSCYTVYDSGGTNNTYTDNEFHACSSPADNDAFWIQHGGGHLVANNLMHDFTGGTRALAVLKHCAGVRVLNNTCDGASNLVRPWEGSSGTVVANNIITNATESGIGNWDGIGAVVNSYNLFYNCAANYSGNTTPGPGEFVADPGFVGSGSFQLQAGSPAINAGTDVGLPFTGPAPDLGYAETTSTTPLSCVKGTVTIGPSVPVAGVAIAVSNGNSAVSGRDGTYRIPLAEGTYTLTPTFRFPVDPTEVEVAVAAGAATTQDFQVVSNPQTYYVDFDQGSDGNPGTQELPWQSIDCGDTLGVLLPGDTVIVNPGTYGATLPGPHNSAVAAWIMASSGLPGYPVTYKAGGPGVVIDGGVTSDPGGFVTGMWVNVLDSPVHDLVIDGFEFRNLSGGIYIEGADSVTVKNCVFHDIVWTSANNTCWASYNHSSTNCSYTDNTFYNFAAPGEALGIWFQYGSGHVVARNLFFDHGSGVRSLAAMRQCAGTRVINNTSDGGSNLIRPWDGSSGTIATNNIILNASESGIGNWDGPGAVVNSYNLFWNCAANYSGNLGPGMGELTADPKFVGGGSYQLQEDSPAIDAGVNVGHPSSGLAPDLGCFESSYSRVGKTSLSDLKNTDDNTLVSLTTPATVVAAPGTFTDTSYNIEDPSRTSGIKVIGAGSAALGDRITVNGVTGTLPGGQRAILSAQITSSVAGSPLVSLGAIGKSIDAKLAGMLVTIWGNVTFKAGDGSYIYVDDGSGLSDGSDAGRLGIRVILSGLSTPLTTAISDNPLPFVSVTGVAGVDVDGSTPILVVRPRGDSDITLY